MADYVARKCPKSRPANSSYSVTRSQKAVESQLRPAIGLLAIMNRRPPPG